MNVSGSHRASRSAPRTNAGRPAVRRAPMSHAMPRQPNPTMYQAAIHLVPTARPSMMPHTTCHLRRPSRGPASPPSRRATPSASLARDWSRSMTMQPNAASTKNIRKMSRMPVLDSTNSRPSRDISSPARQPSRVDRVIRRAMRQISRMASDPNTALENRQPNEFSPNSHSPTAISSLPTSGWTTYSPQLGAAARREQAGGVPGDDQLVGEVGVAGSGRCNSTRPRAAGCSTRPWRSRSRRRSAPAVRAAG